MCALFSCPFFGLGLCLVALHGSHFQLVWLWRTQLGGRVCSLQGVIATQHHKLVHNGAPLAMIKACPLAHRKLYGRAIGLHRGGYILVLGLHFLTQVVRFCCSLFNWNVVRWLGDAICLSCVHYMVWITACDSFQLQTTRVIYGSNSWVFLEFLMRKEGLSRKATRGFALHVTKWQTCCCPPR